MKSSRQQLGTWGETQAADYLQERGYQILERNVRTPYGEIDLIACQPPAVCQPPGSGSLIVFIEVKTRTSATFGLPEESITARKRSHLLAAAQSYLQTHPDLDVDWRIDVIAVQRMVSHPPLITHFENAIQ